MPVAVVVGWMIISMHKETNTATAVKWKSGKERRRIYGDIQFVQRESLIVINCLFSTIMFERNDKRCQEIEQQRVPTAANDILDVRWLLFVGSRRKRVHIATCVTSYTQCKAGGNRIVGSANRSFTLNRSWSTRAARCQIWVTISFVKLLLGLTRSSFIGMAATDSRVINFLVVRQDNSPFGACEDQYCEEKGQEGERERHADKQLIIIITCLSVNRTCLVCWLCILGLEDQFTCSLSNYVDLNQTRQVFPLIQLLWNTFSVWFNATCADSRGKSQGRCSENSIQEQLQNSSGKVKNSETCPSHTIHLELISISIGCVIINVFNWKRELNVKQHQRRNETRN